MKGPINSAGAAWSGETWSCSACGESGPDRNDLPHSLCPKHRTGAHEITYSPREHHAAVRGRR